MMPSIPLRIVVSVAIAALLLAGQARGADSGQFSVAENRLFIDDHLRDVRGPATLEYAYTRRGSLESPVDDTARVVVGSPSAGG